MKASTTIIHYFYLLLSFSIAPVWSQPTPSNLSAPIRALDQAKLYLDEHFNRPANLSCQQNRYEPQAATCIQAKEFYNRHPQELEPQMVALFNQCLKARFELCYPALRPSIKLDELKQIFRAATQDPTFRMKSPEIYCYERANALSHYLAEQGYAAQVLHIDKAPVLIAIDKNYDGKDKGTYNDYEGTHYPVSIQVEVKPGVIETMVLDPQFFNEPMPLEKYLIATTGQKCELSTSAWKTNDESKDFWYCNYRLLDQNFYPLASNAEIRDFPFEQAGNKTNQCGWWNLDKHLAAINNINENFKLNTSSKVPEELKGLSPKELNKSLIKLAYQEKYDRLKQQYDEYAGKLKKLEQDPQAYFKSLVFQVDLSHYTPEQAHDKIGETRSWLIKEMQGYETVMKRYQSVIAEVERNLTSLD